MKNFIKILAVVLLTCILIGCVSACDTKKNDKEKNDEQAESTIGSETVTDTDSESESESDEGDSVEFIDYVGQLKLDMTSSTLKQEVTVKSFIDGDTTHFYVPTSLMGTGVIKARYLAINTPESTGKIEEWGKAASAFTKSKLSSAESIIIESDTEVLNADSTGDRYLLWIWYKPYGSDSYRNLNLEILQNGLAIASNSANNRYGELCMAAIAQAKASKLHVYSGEQDPDFYYGEAQVVTLKELRCNIEKYNGVKVAFTGIITVNSDNAVYVESYDEETDVWYGMFVYYGFGMNGHAMEILSVGNESRIIGTVSYYETGGTYQVSGLSYRVMKPDDPTNIKKLSDGHEPVYLLTTAEKFANGKVEVTFTDAEENETTEIYDYADVAIYSSISMENLYVKSVSTTTNEDSSNFGAMTLICESNGITVKVRTTVFYGDDGVKITADAYRGKTINVKGVIETYMDESQIKVFSPDDITIVE